jgi:hypothetical protein
MYCGDTTLLYVLPMLRCKQQDGFWRVVVGNVVAVVILLFTKMYGVLLLLFGSMPLQKVSDDLSTKDALALFQFLQMRGYIAPLTEAAGEDEQRALSNIVSEMRFCASVPLTGVDMIQASSGTWNT